MKHLEVAFGSKTLRISSLISDSSAYGAVYNTNDPKYVIKLQYLTTEKDHKRWKEEYEIGKKVNPKYASKMHFSKLIPFYDKKFKILKQNINKFKYKQEHKKVSIGYYIIDNLVQKKDHKAVPLYKYVSNFKRNQVCPGKGHPMFRALKRSLLEFYKHGIYHGDLHLGNIYVILKQSTIVSVKIIDFGMSLPFKTKSNRCLNEIMKSIHEQFKTDKVLAKRTYLKNNLKKVNDFFAAFDAPKRYLYNAKSFSAKTSNAKSFSAKTSNAKSFSAKTFSAKKKLKCWTTRKGRSKPYVVCIDRTKLKTKLRKMY